MSIQLPIIQDTKTTPFSNARQAYSLEAFGNALKNLKELLGEPSFSMKTIEAPELITDFADELEVDEDAENEDDRYGSYEKQVQDYYWSTRL